MKKRFSYILSSVMILSACCCFSQKEKINSVLALLQKDKEDTNKVNHLNILGWTLKNSNPDSAILIGNECLQLTLKLSDSPDEAVALSGKKGIANSFSNLGVYNHIKGDYFKALDYHLKALKIDQELNNINGIAKRLGNIGIVYSDQCDYVKALDYYFKALKINEDLGDKKEIAGKLNNIGNIYMQQGNYSKALEYYFKSLKIHIEVGNKSGMAGRFGNIGSVYCQIALDLKNRPFVRDSLFNAALNYYFKALKINEELENKRGISSDLGNIGNAYNRQADFSKALDYYFRALKINDEIGNKDGVAIWLGNIGIYVKTKKNEEAEKYLLDALEINKEIGSLKSAMDVEENLSSLYSQTNRYQLALKHYKNAMALKDTLFSKEKNKELTRKEMNYEFAKKEAAAKAEQDKKDAVTKIFICAVSVGFLLVLLLAIFIFRGYRQKQKANVIISEQKKMVEEKQKDILDSIRYAKRIQTSLLPTEKYLDKIFAANKK